MTSEKLRKITGWVIVLATPLYVFHGVEGIVPETFITSFLGYTAQYTPTAFALIASYLLAIYFQLTLPFWPWLPIILYRALLGLLYFFASKLVRDGREKFGRRVLWLLLLSETLPLLIGILIFAYAAILPL